MANGVSLAGYKGSRLLAKPRSSVLHDPRPSGDNGTVWTGLATAFWQKLKRLFMAGSGHT
jgi:hypothetical protein